MTIQIRFNWWKCTEDVKGFQGRRLLPKIERIRILMSKQREIARGTYVCVQFSEEAGRAKYRVTQAVFIIRIAFL